MQTYDLVHTFTWHSRLIILSNRQSSQQLELMDQALDQVLGKGALAVSQILTRSKRSASSNKHRKVITLDTEKEKAGNLCNDKWTVDRLEI